ncbi:uncharacterized protein [Brachyistius frenatus]|uniref:uncharacterized protein n=1 Tax=Brachyistius frenatus TaxID=100188 RepID=UPI0037E7F44D
MAAVGAEVTGSWFPSSGVVMFFILVLLLSIFLTALCGDCYKHSFKLEERPMSKNSSILIKVVKLEEARENPTINEIQNDEKEFHPHEENPATLTPSTNHLEAPQTQRESHPEEEASVPYTPWRSHLAAPQNGDLNSSSPPDSNHIYQTVREGRDSGGDAPWANHKPAPQRSGDACPAEATAADLRDRDRNSIYARVSKKLSTNTSPVCTPEEAPVEEESSPPLPERRTQLEG